MPDYTILLPAKPKVISEDEIFGQYEIDGLYPGYGHTLGNSLRRIILSSLPGTSITTVRIDGVNNEFSAVEGIREDVITILLNLKNVRIQMSTDEPQTLKLKVKGEKTVTAGDIETTGQTTITNPELEIAHLTDKNAELSMEMTVERGLGYVAKEKLKEGDNSIGTITTDAVFTPIKRVRYEVESMRVGDRTDYNRLRLFIETDGTIEPREALDRSIATMIQQLQALTEEHGTAEPVEAELEYTPSTNATGPTNDGAGSDDADQDETEFLKTRIDDLDLSARTLNALSEANIRTVGGLARKRESDIQDIDGIGSKGIQEIRDLLHSKGIELKE
ncbi:MAG: DNA-directed RNA polymerase subunit alpha [Candidatus Paceibacterota bacterium]